MTDIWRVAFVQPMEEFFRKLGAFLPHLMAMVVIIVVGWAVAIVAGAGIARLLKVARFDPFCVRIGFAQALAKGGVREAPSNLAGRMVYWAILLVFFLLGLGALELRPVDHFLDETFSYIPRIVVAATILVLGFVFANFFGRATLIGAVNAQIVQARVLARGVRLAILFFALAMAFEQLGIATSIIVAAFSITFGGVVLAFAIAFGLGAKDSAKAIIEKRVKPEPEVKENDFSHL
jgi:hypothetical protein